MTKTKLRANRKGHKISLELTVKKYERLLDDLEELEAMRACAAAVEFRRNPDFL